MYSFEDLKEKNILVVGGSKGIGKDIAAAFADKGASVVITGRNKEDLEKAEAELKSINKGCTHVQADITKIDDIEKMVAIAEEHMGRIDVLVNNAGTNIAKPALEVTENDWDTVLDTNLKGTFFCSQKVGRHMIDEGIQGKIINIVSQMAFVGYVKRAAYCSSKGGAVQLTKALAVEWAHHQIKVNAVAPTFIKTDLTSGMFQDEDFYSDVLSRIPLGSLAKPSDVTGTVLFLASNMADFITGETIKVDGGWTAI
ncbi:2-deoxy-D-gluconate 3-dehydrogenase [Virgibacillus sp. 7505]|uniref:SDR family NAD(P)-dependent oxidoreductase n=1 Tax=Virgibacillus sp. 7505 TaxID=2022548 RepID=UPI000BA4EFB4|nr:glucose 1-dehydrogenase [Virgibacillus sp. 7505]PAE14718.1 2-deoxy-D-gluconate 3-dehydrogenase [Virgibacillus sp. 7505]